jgi:hypothetical protein
MTPEQTDFYQRVILPLERRLLSHALGGLFSGILYDIDGEPVTGLKLPDMGENGLYLNSVDMGRLFMAPDDSVVSVLRLREQDDGTPAGVNVLSSNPFVQEGDDVAIVAYTDVDGNGVRLDAINLRRLMLAAHAPARFCTVAFGLLASTAYRFGFAEITLFAGGRGLGQVPLDEDDLVGYQVWPKFGFDAPLVPADLNRDNRFARCRSVQDVVAVDAEWWAANGRGIEMRFDLAPGSRSWNVLLNYLHSVFAQELP